MFPYPSGRIHMGHVRNYAIGDAITRYKRMRGYNVLHPMGWDAFGLPAENAAIDNGVHPAVWTYENIATMKSQMKTLGISYDWDREVATCDPEYYRWEQLIFVKMFERGLAYRKSARVNWCPSCQTVLANEQVEAGRCWRCDSEVVIKEIEGWYFKITAYAEELLEWCDRLTGWPERVLTMQRNWIGRSEGAEFDLPVAGRPGLGDPRLHDAARHVLRDDLRGPRARAPARRPARRPIPMRATAVAAFRAEVARESEIERLATDRPKRGLRLRARAVNPFNGVEVPLFLADYVLMGYGTGAIMAVPGEDQRDWDFAKAHGLPIIETVQRPTGWTGEAYTGDGPKINSGFLDGLTVAEAKRKSIDWLVERGLGTGKVNYRLRDWGISRQRYWGAPIPIVYCPKDGTVAERPERLPVVLPAGRPDHREGRLAHRRRAGIRQHDLSPLRRAGPARDGHDGHLRGLVVVLPPVLLAAAPRAAWPTRTPSTTGCPSTSTRAASSTRSCTSSTRASTRRSCATWATSSSTSRSRTCSPRAWSSRTAPRCRSPRGTW